MVSLKTPSQIEKLRAANALVARTLDELERHIKPGISLLELDKIAEDFILSHGAKPSFKGLYGFSGAICLSVNEVCIHGIPDEYVLKEGDLLKADVGTLLDGFYGDAARSFGVGEISEVDKKLIKCTKEALDLAVEALKPGMRVKELSALLGEFIAQSGFVPLLGYCGHGIGSTPHEEPQILNYLEQGSRANSGPKFKNGMVFCVEPMICQKDGRPVNLKGDWNTAGADMLHSAHWEHCIALYNGRAQVLSL